MATIGSPAYYKNGILSSSRLVGNVGDNYVVRYILTLDSGESASHIAVLLDSGGYISWSNYDGTQNEINGRISLYFKIGTDPEEFANAGYNQIAEATGKVDMQITGGYPVEENLDFNAYMEADIKLRPGVEYYLWIYPGWSPSGNYATGYFGWYDRGDNYREYRVTLSGSAGGLAVLENGNFIFPNWKVFEGGEWQPINLSIHDIANWKP